MQKISNIFYKDVYKYMNNHYVILFNDSSTYLESKQNFKEPNLYINKAKSIDRKNVMAHWTQKKEHNYFNQNTNN